jgi:hypothetical protein
MSVPQPPFLFPPEFMRHPLSSRMRRAATGWIQRRHAMRNGGSCIRFRAPSHGHRDQPVGDQRHRP